MASLTQNHAGQMINENRKYFYLREMVPTIDEGLSSLDFMLHNKWWRICVNRECACLDSSLSLVIFGENYATHQFNVRMGILGGEFKENFVVANAGAISDDEFCVHDFVRISLLDLMMQSNNLFLFFVDIEIKDVEKEQKEKVCKGKFGKDYKEMLLSGKNADLVINVKGRKFNCHSIILGARAPAFSAMLEREMKEKGSSEVLISDADPSVFQDFLLYLYTGKEEHLKCDYIADLFRLADKYCVDDLKYHCIECIKCAFPIKNFIDVFLISQQQSDSELTEAAIECFLENTEDIVENEKWIEFTKEHPCEAHVLTKALAKSKHKCQNIN